MALTKTILTLAFIAVFETVDVHTHPTDLATQTSNVSSNKTFPRYSGCYSKLTPKQIEELQSKNGMIGDNYRWPDGIMYYTYDNSVTRSNKKTIEKGMQLITRRTCFTFRPRTNQKNYVLIKTNDPRGGCFAYIGMLGGQQILNLNQQGGCISAPFAAHELIHAIGFEHEHQRNDRDDYITVMYDNIQEKYNFTFDNTMSTNTYGFPYNVRSIMHYAAYNLFAIDIKKPVMVSKNKDDPIPASQNEDLTGEDADKINAMYENECML